jgi:predicted nucleic acid-binding protein
MLLVDANIFIELFLGQEKAEECERFLEENSQSMRSKLRLTILR